MLDVVIPEAVVRFDAASHERAEVTVAVTLYDYGDVVESALASVVGQDLRDLDLVVVDDCSTDGGAARVAEWMRINASRFGRCRLLAHPVNRGLADARNQGFCAAATPFVFVLDADNEIYPRCLAACLEAAHQSGGAAVYTLLEVFGDEVGIMGTDLWDPAALRTKNYIDAMALVRHSAWREVGGYRRMPVAGWEDYDMWLKFAERGFEAIRLPEILCRYRNRGGSMLRTVTNRAAAIEALREDIRLHHPAG